MPSQAEIARHLKVSRAYINKLVKKGMPTSGFQEATDWKNAHASKRAPTDPKQLARFIAEERDDNSSGACRRKYLEEKPEVARLSTEHTLDEALQDAIVAAR